jgi:CheY-like chemotaxis protein
MPDAKKVVAVLDDLLFMVKIQEAARQAGFEAVFVKDTETLYGHARQRPSLIILDLVTRAVPVLAVAARLKSDPEFAGVAVIGYLPHVQIDLKKQAQETGLDMVLARSVFSTSLPQILARHAA